jgi:hypothetical protein
LQREVGSEPAPRDEIENRADREEALVQVRAFALEHVALRDFLRVRPDEEVVAAEPDRHEQHREDRQRRHDVLDHATHRHAPSRAADEKRELEEERAERDREEVHERDEPREVEVSAAGRERSQDADAGGDEAHPDEWREHASVLLLDRNRLLVRRAAHPAVPSG